MPGLCAQTASTGAGRGGYLQRRGVEGAAGARSDTLEPACGRGSEARCQWNGSRSGIAERARASASGPRAPHSRVATSCHDHAHGSCVVCKRARARARHWKPSRARDAHTEAARRDRARPAPARREAGASAPQPKTLSAPRKEASNGLSFWRGGRASCSRAAVLQQGNPNFGFFVARNLKTIKPVLGRSAVESTNYGGLLLLGARTLPWPVRAHPAALLGALRLRALTAP